MLCLSAQVILTNHVLCFIAQVTNYTLCLIAQVTNHTLCLIAQVTNCMLSFSAQVQEGHRFAVQREDRQVRGTLREEETQPPNAEDGRRRGKCVHSLSLGGHLLSMDWLSLIDGSSNAQLKGKYILMVKVSLNCLSQLRELCHTDCKAAFASNVKNRFYGNK